MGKVGIIAFAFGQQGEKGFPLAGPTNCKITMTTWRIYAAEKRAGNDPMIAAQWETSLGLPRTYVRLVSQFDDRAGYVDTKMVLDKSIEFLTENDAERVILVGHPLHLFFIKLLIKMDVWKIGNIRVDSQYDKLMKSIPYDQSPGNVQWWTRNPVVFVAYMAKALVTRKHGA